MGIDLRPGSIQARQTDVYASAQLSRLFDRLAYDHWQDTWLPVLEDPSGGFNPAVDAVLGLRWSGRGIYNELLIYSRVDAHWREAELARMTQLQDDFLDGTIAADRAQLLADYQAAMAADPSTVMGYGCAAQASAGFRRHALELSQGITFITGSDKTVYILVDDQGDVIDIIVIDDGIVVVGQMPGIFTGLRPGEPPPPFAPPPGNGGNAGGPGGGGGTGGGGANTNPAPRKPCTSQAEQRWTSNMLYAARCPTTPPAALCEMSPGFKATWETYCGADGIIANRPPAPEPPPHVPPEFPTTGDRVQDFLDTFRDSAEATCRLFCGVDDPGWSGEISFTGPGFSCNCP